MTWKFRERVELFKGMIAKMSPAPNKRHQVVSMFLSTEINLFLKGSSCSVFAAPFDVRLPVSLKEGRSDTVVQPDITVICDTAKLDEQGCNGAPDIVVEILSPSNSKRELKDKFDLYEASLIPEYWIVDPNQRDIVIYTLNDELHYVGSRPYVAGALMTSEVLGGLEIDVAEVFQD